MADKSLRTKLRDSLIKYLAPPIAGLIGTAAAGPVTGVGAAAGTAALIDVFGSHEEYRKAERQINEIADKAVAELAEFIAAEWQNSQSSETPNPEVAVRCLSDVVQEGIANGIFFKEDLRPEAVKANLFSLIPKTISAGEKRLVELALPKTVDVSLAFLSRREEFDRLATQEILSRLSDLSRQAPQIVADAVGAALTAREADVQSTFEANYRRSLGRVLDRIELFGIKDRHIHYPLQQAFITLQLSGGPDGEGTISAAGLLDSLRPGRSRLLIKGEAGAGKSTLLQWAAVTAAYRRHRDNLGLEEVLRNFISSDEIIGSRPSINRSFKQLTETLELSKVVLPSGETDGEVDREFLNWLNNIESKIDRRSYNNILNQQSTGQHWSGASDWRSKVPLFLRLRDLEKGRFPASGLNSFLMVVSHLGDPPTDFVSNILKAGRGLLLLDGVDEVNPSNRSSLLETINNICTDYSEENYILVTTRPEAAETNWLRNLNFREASVEPLETYQKEALIDQWYRAMQNEFAEIQSAEDVVSGATRMKLKLKETPPLNLLASNPLICSLLCAYNQLGRELIPERSHEIARELSELILERRDRDRGLDADSRSDAYRMLGYANKRQLTEQIAFYMMENEEHSRSGCELEDVRHIVNQYVSGISEIGEELAPEVLRGLVERSGMLKETAPHRLGFIHNFFKEFHASAEYVRKGFYPKLAMNGYDAAYRPVVIFAASKDGATTRIIRELLKLRPNQWPVDGQSFTRERDLLALQCGLTGRPHEYVDELTSLRAQLFPPQNMREARLLAELGDDAVPFLSRDQNRQASAREHAACIRALGLIGTQRADTALEAYRSVKTKTEAYELAKQIEPLAVEKVRDEIISNGGANVNWPIRNRIRDLSYLGTNSDITELRLFGTKVTDLSPLEKLENLETLDLDNSSVSDLSPIEKFENLKWLVISGTRVTDLKPLSGVPTLLGLFCSNTEVSDLKPIANLSRLKILELRSKKVVDLTPLANLDDLLQLFVSGTEVDDLSPISKISGLKELYIDDTKVSDLGPIANLLKLEDLNIEGTPIQVFDEISNLHQLKQLDLSNTDFDDLRHIENLSNLQTLVVGSTNVLDLSPLVSLEKLENLHLYNTNVSDISPLMGLKQLKHLTLSKTKVVDLAPLKHLKNLEHLSLYNTPVSDISALSHNRNIKFLDLEDTQVSDISPLSKLKKLEWIDVCGTDVTDLNVLSKMASFGMVFFSDQTEKKSRNFKYFSAI